LAAGAAADGFAPQPQPAPPVDFTSASSAQHAPESFGAGPPQQPVAASGVVDMSLLFESFVFVMSMESP
jgi:hypothetical protein